MTKRILKIIGSLSFALVIALGSFFVPKIKKSQVDCASAYTSGDYSGAGSVQYKYFDTTNFYFGYFGVSSTANNMSPSITNNVDLDYISFDFSASILTGVPGSSSNLQRYYLATRPFLTNSSSSLRSDLSQMSYDRNGFHYVEIGSYSELYASYLNSEIFQHGDFSRGYSYYYDDNFVGYYSVYHELVVNYTTTSDFYYPSAIFNRVILTNSNELTSVIGVAPTYENCSIVILADTNNCFFITYIPSRISINDYPWITYKTCVNFVDLVEFSDNQYYLQGVTDGYADGYVDGESSGYTDGYNVGDRAGFVRGYNEGLNTADNGYTFYNLIGAVFDAPLNTFTSLFNFEILGVNILNFLSSILTLCIVIWLIKIALGGK